MAAAVVPARASKTPMPAVSLWHFDLSQIGHPKVSTYQNIRDAEADHEEGTFGSLPFMVRSNCIKDAKVTDSNLASQISIFRTNFKVSDQAKQLGRAGSSLRHPASEVVTKQLVKEVCPFIDQDAAIDNGLKGLHLWGFVSNYKCQGRTEAQFLGTSRCVLEGRRLLWTISIQHAVTAKRNLDPTGPADMDALVKFIFSLSQPQIKWMLQHRLYIWHKMQHSGTALWTPAAYLVFERICVLRHSFVC